MFHVVDDPSGTPINKKITVASVFNAIPTFIGLNSTVTYTSSGAMALTEAISILNASSSATQMTLETHRLLIPQILCWVLFGFLDDRFPVPYQIRRFVAPATLTCV